MPLLYGRWSNQSGPFYESLNLAALWELPVIYIIENNGYSMGTAKVASAGEPLARRGEAFDIDWKVAHGHDLYEVRDVVHEAVERAHSTSKPSVLEIITYRYEVTLADPTKLSQEIEEYKKNKDPHLQDKLLDEGVITEEKHWKLIPSQKKKQMHQQNLHPQALS